MTWMGWLQNRARRRALALPWPKDQRTGWESQGRQAAADLSAEAEAFLLGRLVEYAEARNALVPVWAWTNLLAHGPEADLRADSRDTWLRPDSPWRPWHQARSYVSAEVLQHARSYASLAELQRRVLVPLELRLACGTEVAKWAPGHWAMAVERALGQTHTVR